MAFPACSVVEKIYRNSISDVADYLESQHSDNYLVINVSNRLYDYSKFENKVKDFEWHDHQAPALTTLVHIGF
jgi:phosphatidylinositol-3,4,5-trisphosphate 3-phosphatase and dual-specificity protein phosphatase PTEN